jgi:hypothetical protein
VERLLRVLAENLTLSRKCTENGRLCPEWGERGSVAKKMGFSIAAGHSGGELSACAR